MAPAVPDILARIVEHKRAVARAVTRDMEGRASDAVPQRRDFHAAIRTAPAIIAEIKKASPSKGLIAGAEFDPAGIAKQYEQGGAAALSVLTDAENFQGALEHLQAARAAVRVPVLRKDFTLSEYDVVEAAAAGADAVLLIAAILTADQMRQLRETAESYGMDALVEVHARQELAAALDSGARIIGVNSRNLHTFEVSLRVAQELAADIPANITRVAESGIYSNADVLELQRAGYNAFLVGEHLMKARDRAAAVRALRGAGSA